MNYQQISVGLDILELGLKRVFGYSYYSGTCQTSTRNYRPTRVLGIYKDGRKLCSNVGCGDYLPQVCGYHCYYVVRSYST